MKKINWFMIAINLFVFNATFCAAPHDQLKGVQVYMAAYRNPQTNLNHIIHILKLDNKPTNGTWIVQQNNNAQDLICDMVIQPRERLLAVSQLVLSNAAYEEFYPFEPKEFTKPSKKIVLQKDD